MSKVIVMLLLAMLSSGAAAEWVKVGNTSAKGGVEIYVDPATIRRSGNMVKMWAMYDFKTEQVDRGERYLSSKSQDEYDCKGEQWRRIYFTWHSEKMTRGDVVYSYDGIASNWEPVSPGSVNERIWKLACGKK